MKEVLMNRGVNTNEELIKQINVALENKKDCTINIINDKLTLSVFTLLEKNLKNVKQINFIIRDTNFLPKESEISREFQLDTVPNDMLFNSYDIVEKNKLLHFAKAKDMYNFIKKYVNVRKTTKQCQIRGNVIVIDEDFMLQGSSSLELSNKVDKGRIHNFNFNTVINSTMDKEQIIAANHAFNTLWYSTVYTEDYKKALLKSLSYVYKEHSPEFLYYFTLNELFGSQLDYGIDRFEKDHTQFKKTKIWNMLFDFQKDAVLSAIQKISKYNGCIIADSVGLGKTFEALAVIKYFELRQDNVLVLSPAKLYDNWASFKGDYVDSPIEGENFHYKIMFHTDLSRTSGFSREGKDLSRFDWSRFDLIVIDESHNFRNRTEREDGFFTRYQRLLQAVSKGRTKMLLLSATPVNNSLSDLKNQISLITSDRDNAFEEQGIKSIDNLLRRTSKAINDWEREASRNKHTLFNNLPADFYKLLEMMTISRSRKHITNYYGTERIGKFPLKLKPDTYTPSIDTLEELINFKETNEKLEQLKLAVYTPMTYVKGEYINFYRQKYDTLGKDGRVLLSNELRESGTKVLHRFNLFKRLESSIFSFGATIDRLLVRINNCIALLEKSIDTESLSVEVQDEEDLILDYEYEIKVEHLNKGNFLEDLYYDKEILEDLSRDISTILEGKRDQKLKVLLNHLKEKVQKTPYNEGNKKVLIFTAFADTANYLYQSLEQELAQIGCYTACISGSYKPVSNNKRVKPEYNAVLSAFSPQSKLKKQVTHEEQIDILIGADCISEGQNLQDCDCVINYDIQWNPVVLIQRFGRIDRIGSCNNSIKMVNFFPDVDLNEYLALEKRVKGKMMSVNIASTGDENLLDPEMNDIEFRRRQLERLKDEVIDLEDATDSISLTDLNMNDYLFELSDYMKKHPEVKQMPSGIYSIAHDEATQGTIFCFKHKNNQDKPKSESSLYPYYLIYIGNDESIYYSNGQARDTLRHFRKLCYQQSEPDIGLFKAFLEETKQAKDMKHYSKLLSAAIKGIQGNEEAFAEQTLFDFGGFNNEFAEESQDDFELISFLVVK